MKILKKRKYFFTILAVLILLLGVFFVITVFGIDQKIINTPLEGHVVSTNGEEIAEAAVKIQNQIATTNEEGKFYFEDLNFGSYEITVNKNGYSPYKSTVKLKRFSNKLTITLKPEEFGEIKFLFEADIYNGDQVEVKINNNAFPIKPREKGFEVNSGRLLTGSYLLEVLSPDFCDIEKRFDVKPGLATETIVLLPAGDLVTEFEDYLNSQAIRPGKIFINGREPTEEEFTENRLELKDLDITKQLKIEIGAEGYLDKVIELQPKQGLNSLGKTILVIEERVLFTDGRSIKSAFFDGSSERQIYAGSSNCEILSQKGSVYLAGCGNKTVAIATENGNYRLLREYNGRYNTMDFVPTDSNLVTIANDRREIITVKSTGNFSVIFSQEKEILSVIADYSGNIYFSDEDGVYKLPADNQTNKISVTVGRYYLQDVSEEGNQILALSREKSTENNIWVIDTMGGQSRKLNFLPGSFTELRFIEMGKFLFLEGDTLSLRELSSTNPEELLRQVNNYWVTPQNKIYFASKQKTGSIVFATREVKLERRFGENP